jgi:D-amino peptidase
VPVVLVSGDDEATGEVIRMLGDVETAIVKRALGFHSAATMTPEAGQALIRTKAKAAIARLGNFKPYRIQAPLTVDLTFKNYTPAEALALLPGTERVDAHTVRFTARTVLDVARYLEFVTTYRSDLSP